MNFKKCLFLCKSLHRLFQVTIVTYGLNFLVNQFCIRSTSIIHRINTDERKKWKKSHINRSQIHILIICYEWKMGPHIQQPQFKNYTNIQSFSSCKFSVLYRFYWTFFMLYIYISLLTILLNPNRLCFTIVIKYKYFYCVNFIWL